jgi:hypothetical protein
MSIERRIEMSFVTVNKFGVLINNSLWLSFGSPPRLAYFHDRRLNVYAFEVGHLVVLYRIKRKEN